MLKNLGLSTITFILALLLGEIFLKVFFPIRDSAHQLFCAYDPLLGWRKRSDFTGTHQTSEYRVTERFNERGQRGPVYPYQKPAGEYRILLLGDSYTEGYMVTFEALFSEIMEVRLDQRCDGKEYEAVNTGVGGYATDQELLFFEQEGYRYQPDLTLLMFCVNDTWFNNQHEYWRGGKPLFRLVGPDSLQLTNVPVPEPEQRSVFQKVKAWLLFHSQLARRLKIAKDKMMRQASGDQVPADYKVYRKDYDEKTRQAWQLTEALLKRLKQVVIEQESRLAICFIPEQEMVYPERWALFRSEYGIDTTRYDCHQPRRELRRICDQLDILLIDPVDSMAEAAREAPGQSFFYPLDGHWNVNGHRFIGNFLAEKLGCDR